MVVMNHVSNVTGAVQPVAETGALLRGSDALFLVDAAQSAGHLPVDMKEWGSTCSRSQDTRACTASREAAGWC